MNKSELLNEHIEKINFAVEKGLGEKNWAIISLLNGGLTGDPVYKIEVKTKFYAIKLENVNDERFDLIRSYQIIETVSKQGISPFVYFANPDHGIILMDYIESKPRPEATPESIQNIAELIRKLHHNNAFSKWKSVIEILYETYSAVPDQYRKSNLIDKSMSEIKRLQEILFDEADVRACHCDLNPVNLLYDGNNYFLVDWQAASPQSFYFDLAYSATWFYFYSENLSSSYLNAYLEREANEEEKAKYYLMRVFTNIYLGIGFISLSFKSDSNRQILSNELIDNLPNFAEFLQLIGSGSVSLAEPQAQQQFGFVFMKKAEKMMDQRFQSAYELLINKQKIN